MISIPQHSRKGSGVTQYPEEKLDTEEIWIAQEVPPSPHAHSRSLAFPNKEADGKIFI